MTTEHFNLLKRPGTNTTLDIARLEGFSQRPPLFALGEKLFWDDPHISSMMLQAHLDPSTDAASRRPETIDASVAWLHSIVGLAPGGRILDLGCGPGLYSQRLARLGYRVTGVDYSHRSIQYAKEFARDHDLDIEYIYQDYLTIDFNGQFDAAILIFCDLGALPNRDRDEVLRRVRRSLKPGGQFVFDIQTALGRENHREQEGWRASAGGFWRPGPHLVLTTPFEYPESDVGLNQYVVIDETGEVTVYRIWDRYYSPESIRSTVAQQGFCIEGLWGDVTGKKYTPNSETIAVVARTGERS